LINLNIITASVVIYKTDPSLLQKLLISLIKCDSIVCIYIIDNSPIKIKYSIYDSKKIIYIYNDSNLGYGSGHNIAIKKSLSEI